MERMEELRDAPADDTEAGKPAAAPGQVAGAGPSLAADLHQFEEIHLGAALGIVATSCSESTASGTGIQPAIAA
jgi:hypothetical protein